jgi:hypothetical protein
MKDVATPITRRIEADHGLAGLAEALATRLPPSDLQSLLLDIFQARAQKMSPARILTQARRGGLLAPALSMGGCFMPLMPQRSLPQRILKP